MNVGKSIRAVELDVRTILNLSQPSKEKAAITSHAQAR